MHVKILLLMVLSGACCNAMEQKPLCLRQFAIVDPQEMIELRNAKVDSDHVPQIEAIQEFVGTLPTVITGESEYGPFQVDVKPLRAATKKLYLALPGEKKKKRRRRRVAPTNGHGSPDVLQLRNPAIVETVTNIANLFSPKLLPQPPSEDETDDGAVPNTPQTAFANMQSVIGKTGKWAVYAGSLGVAFFTGVIVGWFYTRQGGDCPDFSLDAA